MVVMIKDRRVTDIPMELESPLKLKACCIITFCMTSLVIKIRHVTVYHNLSRRSEAFLDSTVGRWLPADIGKAIVSFLTLGDEGASFYTQSSWKILAS
jgi:hypothetical protein